MAGSNENDSFIQNIMLLILLVIAILAGYFLLKNFGVIK